MNIPSAALLRRYCALVKRYHLEQGSDQVDRLFADPDAGLVTANIAVTELTSALDRKCQDGALTREGLIQILAVAAQDLLAEFWLLELDRAHSFGEVSPSSSSITFVPSMPCISP